MKIKAFLKGDLDKLQRPIAYNVDSGEIYVDVGNDWFTLNDKGEPDISVNLEIVKG